MVLQEEDQDLEEDGGDDDADEPPMLDSLPEIEEVRLADRSHMLCMVSYSVPSSLGHCISDCRLYACASLYRCCGILRYTPIAHDTAQAAESWKAFKRAVMRQTSSSWRVQTESWRWRNAPVWQPQL